MTSHLEDASISQGLLVFRGPHRGGYAAKGFLVELPPIENASLQYLAALEAGLRSLLRSLESDVRMQVTWTTDADYREALLAYYGRTEWMKSSEWGKQMRNERFTRYWPRKLRRDQLRVYFSRPFLSGGGQSAGAIDRALEVMSQGFMLGYNSLAQFAAGMGGYSKALTDEEMAVDQAKFLNPFASDELEFDPANSVMENFLLSEGVGIERPDIGFYLGGAYHAVLTLSSLPQATCSGLIQQLTSLPIRDFSLTVNISPLDATREVEKAEEELKRLRHTLTHSARQRMVSAAEMKQEKIARLMTGAVSPFRAQFVLRAWDETKEGLREKMGALKSAVVRMRSAKPLEAAFPTTAMNFYRCSAPGWCWDRYNDSSHYVEDHNLANLLPFSGSNGQNLSSAEALYDGSVGNLIGISGFAGSPGSQAPMHTILTGRTGSGKSLLLNDLLSQTEGHYDFTAIVDDGFSYGGYVEALGGTSFIVEPNGGATFNYLDPQGPLTPEFLADVAGVLMQMCGPATPEVDSKRAAVAARSVAQFYRDVSAERLELSPEILEAVTREAIVFREFADSRQTGSWKESWDLYSRWCVANSELKALKLAAVSETDFTQGIGSLQMIDDVHRLSFAGMDRSEAPTHSGFKNWLEVESLSADRDSDAMGEIATLISPWCAGEGGFGKLFDGPGNVDFKGHLVHIELGRIPESAARLRSLAAFVITNQIKNEIVRRPRSERKRVLLEELGAFLNIPGGESIARDFYERCRKYNCWVISVIQQIGDRIGDAAFISIIGNSKMGIFLKQSNPREAAAIAEAFRLPDSARETLLNLPEPTLEKGAAFVLCCNGGATPQVAVGFNVVHPLMLSLAGSSGDEHDKRLAAKA